MTTPPPTLLEQLNTSIHVDVDTMDSDFVKSLPCKCNDMTSNPRFVHDALVDPRNKGIVEGTVREMKGKPWEEVYASCVSSPCTPSPLPDVRGACIGV